MLTMKCYYCFGDHSFVTSTKKTNFDPPTVYKNEQQICYLKAEESTNT